jgi:predicted DNA-binding transcriptional regulator AlpA
VTGRKLSIVSEPLTPKATSVEAKTNTLIAAPTVAAILDRAAETFATLAAELRELAGSPRKSLDEPGQGEAHGDRVLADDTAKPNIVNNTLMTAGDVGEMLHLDVRTVRRHAHLGLLPKAITIGKALRWKRKTIERWLEEQDP